MVTQPRKLAAIFTAVMLFGVSILVSLLGGVAATPNARADVLNPSAHNNFGDCAYRGGGTGPNTNNLENAYCWLSAEKLINGEPIRVGNYELHYDRALDGPPGYDRGSETGHRTWENAAFQNSIFQYFSESDPEPIIKYDSRVIRRANRNQDYVNINLSNIYLIDKTTGEQTSDFSLAFTDAETSDKDGQFWRLSAQAADVIATGRDMGVGGTGRRNSNSCKKSFDDSGTNFVCIPSDRNGGSFAVTMQNPKSFDLHMELKPRGNTQQAVAFAVVADRVGGDVHPKAGEREELTELESRYSGSRTSFDLSASLGGQPVRFDTGSVGLVPHLHKVHRFDSAPRGNAIHPNGDLVFTSRAVEGDASKALHRYRPEWTCRAPGLNIEGVAQDEAFSFREETQLIGYDENDHELVSDYNDHEVNGHKHYFSPEQLTSRGIELINDPATGISEVRVANSSGRLMGGTYCEVQWQPRFELAELHLTKSYNASSDYLPSGGEQTVQIAYQCTVDRVGIPGYSGNSTTYTNEDLIAAYPGHFAKKQLDDAQKTVVHDIIDEPVIVDVPIDGDPVVVTVPERMRCGIYEREDENPKLYNDATITLRPHPNPVGDSNPSEYHAEAPRNEDGEFSPIEFYVNRKDNLPTHGATSHSLGGSPVVYTAHFTNNYVANREPLTLQYEFLPEDDPTAIVPAEQTKNVTSHLTCSDIAIHDDNGGNVAHAQATGAARNNGHSLIVSANQNFQQVPTGVECQLIVEESAEGERAINRKLFLNGEEVDPAPREEVVAADEQGRPHRVFLAADTDSAEEAPNRFVFTLPAEIPEDKAAHELRLVSDYRPRELDFSVDKHIEGREPFPIGRGALLPADASVMPMTLTLTNNADFPLPAGDLMELLDPSLAGYTVTIGGNIDNFDVTGGERFTIPANGNLDAIRHCFVGANNVNLQSAIPARTELTCQIAVDLPPGTDSGFSYDGEAFTVTVTAERQEPKTEQSSYGATKLSQLIDQMLPNTGVQTMVWILGLGLLALLYGLWRYLRDDKEEN
ncbi:hypothetical protein [Corynebacterium propinquum]|uniref:hypothetical protein n=1 Tax=Corynebacterium propinquum TaxID=43769 RepID=UPI00266F39F8|nr:hypothetical protein [Corynebacterium propinquum]WKS38084.1 hypothetical protein NLL34_08715 [Corynebacterium propinquum]